MKKYPFLFFASLAILIISICTPNVIYESVPKISYIVAQNYR